MKTKLIILAFTCLILCGCKTWDFGDVYNYTIVAGTHSPQQLPSVIDGTKRWGGNMVLEWNPDEMIDTVENFSYWNKLGGLMPDIYDNVAEGYHKSARAAWRVDPEDPAFFYVGYIVYVWGEINPQRGYLLDYDDNRIRIPIGAEFFVSVTQYKDHWGVCVDYGGVRGEIRVDEDCLRNEKMQVVMDPYYGGTPFAPTDIMIRLEIIDTTFLGEISN